MSEIDAMIKELEKDQEAKGKKSKTVNCDKFIEGIVIGPRDFSFKGQYVNKILIDNHECGRIYKGENSYTAFMTMSPRVPCGAIVPDSIDDEPDMVSRPMFQMNFIGRGKTQDEAIYDAAHDIFMFFTQFAACFGRTAQIRESATNLIKGVSSPEIAMLKTLLEAMRDDEDESEKSDD